MTPEETTTRPARAFPSEYIAAPPDQPLIPPDLRATMVAFCTRCDQLAVLSLGGGPDGLCSLCAVSEAIDRDRATRRR